MTDENSGTEHPPADLIDLFIELENAGLSGEDISDFSAILEAARGANG